MQTSAWLILLFPLAGTIVIGLGHRILPGRMVGIVGTAAIAGAFVAAIATFISLQGRGEEERQVVLRGFEWIKAGGLSVRAGLLVDPLSLTMVLFVTGVGALIHLYAIGYMHGQERFTRFFTYLNLFAFSMLVLVLAGNYLLLFLGWEGVGLCSYLLISFWFERPRRR